MARIEGLRIRNFRVLNDVTLGKLWSLQQAEPLTPMTAVIGRARFSTHLVFLPTVLSLVWKRLVTFTGAGASNASDLRAKGGQSSSRCTTARKNRLALSLTKWQSRWTLAAGPMSGENVCANAERTNLVVVHFPS